MEKFLVKTKRESTQRPPNLKLDKCYRQTSIQSLKGVVVIEDILRYKATLKLKDQSTEIILDTLKQLSNKIPPRNVLRTTKIGHAINKLTKHNDVEVRTRASQIVQEWKSHFEQKLDRPMVEVKCDVKTENLRKAGRKLLAAELRLNEKHTLPDAIEREVFYLHKQLLSKKYRRCLRTLVFTLKHQDDVRDKVLNQEMDIREFVSRYKDSSKT